MSPSDGAGCGGAGAVLTIDLGAVARNYRLLRDRLRGARCAAVVKADAYGLGLARVTPALAGAGCRDFFVATLKSTCDQPVGLSLAKGRSAGMAAVVYARQLPCTARLDWR